MVDKVFFYSDGCSIWVVDVEGCVQCIIVVGDSDLDFDLSYVFLCYWGCLVVLLQINVVYLWSNIGNSEMLVVIGLYEVFYCYVQEDWLGLCKFGGYCGDLVMFDLCLWEYCYVLFQLLFQVLCMFGQCDSYLSDVQGWLCCWCEVVFEESWLVVQVDFSEGIVCYIEMVVVVCYCIDFVEDL